MSFLYPYVLFALALPLLLAVGIVISHRRAGVAWRRLVSPRHPELVHRLPAWRVALPVVLALVALAGIIIAAARPINGYGQGEGTASGRNLLIALDISRSMETQDVSPSRLEEARAAAYELIDALPGDKIGLIVFAGEADVVVPLTYDHTALRDALEQVNRDWAGYGGTNFGLLLRAAMQNFARSAPDGANALVILSDGEDTVDSSLQIAEEAREGKLLVITVGIGTPAGGAIPDPQGENGLWQDSTGRHVISKLDVAALRRFAEATGGDFFTMNSGADLAAFARQAVEKLERHEESFATGREPLDIFAWFAVPALLALVLAILLGSEWRIPRHTAVLALALLGMGHASAADDKAEAYRQGLLALEKGESATAREQLSTALLSEDPALQAAVHLALGNIRTRATFDKLRALYGQGEAETPASPPGVEALQGIADELKADLTPYRDALAADPSLAAAQQNVEKVEALIQKIEEEIERLKQQQNEQQNQQDNRQDSQDNKDNQQDNRQNGKDDQSGDKDNQQDGKDDQSGDKDRPQDGKDDQSGDKDKPQDGKDDQSGDKDKPQDGKDDQPGDKDNQQGGKDDQPGDKDKPQDGKDDQSGDKDNQQDGKDDQSGDKDKPQDGKDDSSDRRDGKNDQQPGQQEPQDAAPQPQQQEPGQASAQQGAPGAEHPSGSGAEVAELSDEEKSKQRASGILRMHLDEEKGSPIPHFNHAVRPPSKDY